jgi:hypothetical protein
MGREQTELRILLGPASATVRVSAWWGRGGTSGLKDRAPDRRPPIDIETDPDELARLRMIAALGVVLG